MGTIVLAGLVLRAVLAARVPLGVDEAYYVDWARHLQPGYLDHPPLVAWLMAPALHLFGPAPFAVRLPAVLLQAGTTLLAASLTHARGGERAGLLAAVLLQAVPAFSVGAVLMTPDAPLAFAWVGTLWAFERALRRSPRWFLAAGVFLGLAALSKLTAGFLGLALFTALLVSADGRRLLATPWPWLGSVVALAVASPMLLWNVAHDWPSFAFQAQHGLRGRSFSGVRLLQSIGAQAAYVSPILLALAAGAAARTLEIFKPQHAVRSPTNAASNASAMPLGLAFSAIGVVVFFTLAAALTPGALPHWPAPGWLSALLLLTPTAAAWTGTSLRWLKAGVATGLVMVMALLALVLLPLPLPRSPLDEVEGWREGALAAQAAAGKRRIAASHWMVYGEMALYTNGDTAYVGDRPSGPTFYQRPWSPMEPFLLVTVDKLGPGREALEARLGPLESAGSFTAVRNGRPIRRYSFWNNQPDRRTPKSGINP